MSEETTEEKTYAAVMTIFRIFLKICMWLVLGYFAFMFLLLFLATM